MGYAREVSPAKQMKQSLRGSSNSLTPASQRSPAERQLSVAKINSWSPMGVWRIQAAHRVIVLKLLTNGVFGELAFEGGVKADDNIGFGNSHFYEFGGDVVFGAVVLEPNFAVFNVEV